MTILRAPLSPPRPAGTIAVVALAVSLLLHALALALLLPRPANPGKAPPEPPIYATVELVRQDTPAVGNASARPSAAHPPTSPSRPAPMTRPAPPPPSPGGAAPPRPVVEAVSPPPTPSAPPAVNLGDMPDLGTGLVSGDAVVPPRPDSGYRNQPPPYPAEAARLHEQGTVLLLIHVRPDGSAGAVDLLQSSGFPILDQTAREAALRWRFHPAERDGMPVASALPFSFRFRLGP